MKKLLALLFLFVHVTLFAAAPSIRYYSGGKYFNAPYEACIHFANPAWTYYRMDNVGNTINCVGIRKNDKTGKQQVYAIVEPVLTCDDNGTKPNGGQCPEKCPDGSIKQPGKECPKKCPAKDSIGPQYPYETPVGYRCEGGCIVEVSRAVVDSGCWKSIKRPF